MGSPAHDAAAYLVGQLEALGLEAQVQVSSSAGPAADFASGSVPAGRVRNILARLPGTDSTGTVLLVGNYDSMPTTPARPTRQRARRSCWRRCGPCAPGRPAQRRARRLRRRRAQRADRRQAFVAQNPWAREAGFVLAFSSSGVGGAVALQTTTPAGQRFLAESSAPARIRWPTPV